MADSEDDYHLSLGRFIDGFSKLETLLTLLLRSEAGLLSPVGAALIPSVRIDQAVTTIRRVREAKKLPANRGLEKAFGQLKAIAQVRNDLVHYGTTEASDGTLWLATDIAHFDAAKVRVTRISSQSLQAMTHDLFFIMGAIVVEFDHNLLTLCKISTEGMVKPDLEKVQWAFSGENKVPEETTLEYHFLSDEDWTAENEQAHRPQ